MQPISQLIPSSSTTSPIRQNSPQFTLEQLREFNTEGARQHQREIAEHRRQVLAKQAEQLFQRSAMPVKFLTADLSYPMPPQERAFEVGRKYAQSFSARLKDGRGMVLHGSGTMAQPADVGTGKSWMLCAIGNALLKQGRTVLYCTAIEAVQRVRASYSNSGETEFGIIKALCQPDVLLLDELGVQHDTDFEQRIIEQIMDGRQRQGKPTLFATNLGREAILALVGVRTFDRMRDGWFIPMLGKSLRGAGVSRA